MARAILCLLLCAVSFAQRGVISGVVVEAASGDPVRKAVVTATWQGTPRSWATTQTDGLGRFIFEGLPAGNYDLRADKPGLGTAIYGANSVRELGDLITLGEGDTHSDVKLKFLRSGIISGHVTDQDGDPVQGVNVSLLRGGRNLGERILVNYRSANTDDRGEYKIPDVDLGDYYVFCNPNAARNSGSERPMMVPQYYGGARDSKGAAMLHARAGNPVSRVDFQLSTQQPAKVVGRVAGVPDLGAPENVEAPGIRRTGDLRAGGILSVPGGFRLIHAYCVSITMSPAEGGPVSSFFTTGVCASGPDYRFELPGQATGRYRVVADVRVKDKPFSASQVVDAGEGTTDIVLTLAPAVDVKGHLKVEGPETHPVESFTVALAPPGSGPRQQSRSSRVARDGSFTIAEVPPGDWMMNITPNVPGIFEKSVALGDKDFLFKKIEIPPGSDAPLNVVISSNTGIVEGEIDAGGADAKRAGILLEPVGKFHTLARFYYSVASDDAGKFQIKGVAPGKYKIFALEKIATQSYRNPESGDLLDALGQDLEVEEGAKVQAHPKLIGEEQAKEILKP